MKHLKQLLLLTFLLTSTISFSQTVHYTSTGKKYHSEGCQYLRKSDFTCDLKEALGMGLTPCSRCAPPTKVVEKEKPKVEKKERTKSNKTSYYSPSYYPLYQYRNILV